MTSSQANPIQSGSAIAGRYRIEETLGRGGAAVVYRVLDLTTETHLALKRLLLEGDYGGQRSAIALFEREYLTLAQLVHPRIVSAYDYGVDESGPYYTMELLDGGDLQRRAPMAYREACAVARDVCSALSLLHSRRMVYRDLSARNVRCTSSGLAKLIDFGAMSAMGPSREWVGTLPYSAPEAVYSQPLDARTDLYALGATLYYTLTKRHAYPARDPAHLYTLWQARPPAPSQLVPGIPEALDCLVMDLMNPDPSVRPASAAEVMERLNAIAGLPPDEQPLVSKAYLATPTLVGRAAELKRIRKVVSRSMRKRGASLLIEGAPGAGRSRLLEACVLEAKLGGSLVLQVDSSDVRDGGYDIVRALADQLLRSLPDLALAAAEPRLPVLGHVLPELVARKKTRVVLEKLEDPEQLSRSVQPALRRWLIDISRRKPLLIAVDDVNEIDEPSLAFLALLSQEISEHGIVVAATAASTTSAPGNKLAALKLLSDSSTSVPVEALSIEHAEQLLRSVFGDAPNLGLLTRQLHEIGGGRPRDILRLAQHLVDEGVVRYQAGAWSVPERVDAAQLPSSMTHALKAKVDALSPDGRELARALAHEPRQRFSFEECLLLVEHKKPARLMASLDELVAADLVRRAGVHFSLIQEGVLSALAEGTDQLQVERTHLRLAAAFELRGDGFRLARHLVHGGEIERGLDTLIEHAERSRKETGENPAAYAELLQSLPADWLALYELAIRLCQERGRPQKQLFQLRARLSGLLSITLDNQAGAPHYAALIEQLYRASGLDIHARLDGSLDPRSRLTQTLEEARRRYDANPDGDLVLEPMAAIPQLVRGLLEALGLIAGTQDLEFLRRLPALDPLEPVMPSLGIAIRLGRGLEARMTGRIEDSLEAYHAYVRRLLEPDGAGLAPTLRLYTRLRVLGSIGFLEAAMGLPSSLGIADEMQAHPLCETTGALIRMLYHVWQGDTVEAERCQRQVEVLQVQNGTRQAFGGQHLLSELAARALADDLTRVKRTIAVIEPFSRIHAGWRPAMHYGRGEYQRIRGDHSSALLEFQSALELMEPAAHQVWPYTAGAHVRTLCELKRHHEALAFAEDYLAMADQKRLGYLKNYLFMPLALAQGMTGDHARAAETAWRVIDGFSELGTTGLNLALAYETRAKVALFAGDRAGFEQFAALSAKQLPSGGRRMAGARYERLAHSEGKPSSPPPGSDDSARMSEFTASLRNVNTRSDRARSGIELLAQQSGAIGGLLYENQETGLVLCGSAGGIEPDSEIESLAREYFQSEGDEHEVTRSVIHSDSVLSTGSEWKVSHGAHRFVPVLLGHQSKQGFALTGLALLAVQPEGQFVYPNRFAEELSRIVLEAGDATAFFV